MVFKNHSYVMQKIRVKLFANFREIAKTGELEVEGATVRDVIYIICRQFQGMRDILFKNDHLQPYVHIFLNTRDIHELDGMDTSLVSGDEIAIFPPVSGG